MCKQAMSSEILHCGEEEGSLTERRLFYMHAHRLRIRAQELCAQQGGGKRKRINGAALHIGASDTSGIKSSPYLTHTSSDREHWRAKRERHSERR